MRIEALMNTHVMTCSPFDSLRDVALSLMELDCGSLPVTDPETQQVLGMITDRDICLCAAVQDQRLGALQVEQAMSSGGVTWSCKPTDTVADAERTMQRHQVRRIPVVDHAGRLLGLITQRDLLAAACDDETDVSARETLETLAAIGERRPG